MAINRGVRAILKALSYGGIDLEPSRQFANLKALDPMKPFYHTIDYKIYNNEHEVPTRIYMPGEQGGKPCEALGCGHPILLFFHGGGWVTESAENYDRVCSRMASSTNHIVVSVDYRLAPENKFPIPLEDCYAAAQALFQGKFLLNADPDKITVIGDSAGGNLAAALCLLAKERGKFMPKRQILIYPALSNDYSENSPYPSVHENGTDFLLTARKMCDYLDMYAGCEEDRQSPYFAPLLADDLSGQPKTLIITAEYDPLRDEGEEYGRRLIKAGTEARICRIEDALHGYFALGIKFLHVQESFKLINGFLKEVWEDA